MPNNESNHSFDAGFLFSAAAAWGLSAGILLCLAAAMAGLTNAGETALGYYSSALSFLTAAAAGAAAARRRQTGGILTAFAAATAIIILLLTIGFMIKGEHMDPSAVLSVVSFTCAGCLVGSCLFFKPVKKTGKRPFRTRN